MSHNVATLRDVDEELYPEERHSWSPPPTSSSAGGGGGAGGRRGGARRFMVRSLGWTVVSAAVELDNKDDHHGSIHSRVNSSISRLSLGRHDMTDAVGRWGDVS